MDTANISTKPYLIRALYEWCLDSGCTPHLAVWVNEHTRVPAQYVQDNQIVLSISPSATKDLTIDNEWIHFHARFAGVSHEIWIPVGHVLGIFAKETAFDLGRTGLFKLVAANLGINSNVVAKFSITRDSAC